MKKVTIKLTNKEIMFLDVLTDISELNQGFEEEYVYLHGYSAERIGIDLSDNEYLIQDVDSFRHFLINEIRYYNSETDIYNMVDASKEYMDLSDKSNNDSRLDKLISIVKSIREEVAIANNASSGAFAGLPPDSPPVNKKKRKPTPVGRYGSRRAWWQDVGKNGK